MALYLEHFGLKEPPFRITPHTDFFFGGGDRAATLEALLYAVLHDEGIVKVSGEVGSGKTMLCRMLMERLPAQVDTIYLATASLGRDEILLAIAEELDIAVAGKRTATALRKLQERLIQAYGAGRRVVILIDEAHAMPDETLEQVRLLSNLESSRHKLLQIVLFGQPELDETLAKASMRQLRDRVTHSFRMRPFTVAEVTKYLSFRMRAAGYRGPEVFTPRAVARMARSANGLTRRVNILADKALLSAFSEGAHAVTARHARAAIIDTGSGAPRRWGHPLAYVTAAALAGLALGSMMQWSNVETSEAASPAPDALRTSTAPPLEPTPPPAHLDAEQMRRLGGYSAVDQPLLAERLVATREVLQRAPDTDYAIELFVAENSDPARMERFLVRARDMVPLDELYVIPIETGPHYRLRVVLGRFKSVEKALEAEKRLPPKYRQAFHTGPRSFADLRGEI